MDYAEYWVPPRATLPHQGYVDCVHVTPADEFLSSIEGVDKETVITVERVSIEPSSDTTGVRGSIDASPLQIASCALSRRLL